MCTRTDRDGIIWYKKRSRTLLVNWSRKLDDSWISDIIAYSPGSNIVIIIEGDHGLSVISNNITQIPSNNVDSDLKQSIIMRKDYLAVSFCRAITCYPSDTKTPTKSNSAKYTYHSRCFYQHSDILYNSLCLDIRIVFYIETNRRETWLVAAFPLVRWTPQILPVPSGRVFLPYILSRCDMMYWLKV